VPLGLAGAPFLLDIAAEESASGMGEGDQGQKLEEGPDDRTALQEKFGDVADVDVRGDNTLLKVCVVVLAVIQVISHFC